MQSSTLAFLLIVVVIIAATCAWFATVALSSTTLPTKFLAKEPAKQDQRRLVVMGLAKDIFLNTSNMLSLTNKLKAVFPRVEVWVGENGSTDGTREFLNAHDPALWSVVDLSDLKLPPDRIDRMAALRNALQQRVFSRMEEKEDFYMCVLDFDIPFKLTKVNEWPRALDLLESDKTIGAVTGVGLVQHKMFPKPYFYDTFAYRSKKGEVCKSGTASNWLNMAMKYGGAQFDHSERVGNNFGGVAIYRGYQAKTAEYTSRLADGTIVCEHVPFQDQIGGDVVMSGALLHLS